MHYFEDLKDLLCAELEEYAEQGKAKGKMSAVDLETIHKLSDTIKNIMKINVLGEEMGEDGASFESGYSYRRGRGRNAKRDSMGRYAREGGYSYAGGRDGNMGGYNPYRGTSYRGGGYSREGAKDYMMDRLEEMMDEAENSKQKEALQKCMQALERA